MNDIERLILTVIIGVVATTNLAASLVFLQVDPRHQIPDWLMITPALLPALILAGLRLAPCIRRGLRALTDHKPRKVTA